MSQVLFVYGLSTCFIFTWSWLRFKKVSAPYKEQIKWYWAVSFTYSTYYLGLFIFLVVATFLFSKEISGLAPVDFPEAIKNFLNRSPEFFPPIFSAALLYKAHEFRLFKRIDEFALDRLLSVHHLDQDYSRLKELLAEKDFSPSKKETADNVKMIEKFDVFLSDPLTEPPDLHSGDTITLWRKVSTLLRISESWLDERDVDQRKLIEDLKSEHFRRTGVALHLLRLKLSTEKFQEFDLANHLIEAEQQPDAEEKQSALIISSEQLNQTTRQFSEYFIADYKKLMDAITAMAAHKVIYSGSSAKHRLEQLSESGFHELGSFKDLTFDSITKLLMFVFLGALVLFFSLFSLFSPGMPPETKLLLSAKLATVYAFSALCGASFGASRRLLQRDETPWASYLVAGLSGVLASLAINGLVELTSSDIQGIDTFLVSFRDLLSEILPWQVMPFVLAMGVAGLSRKNPILEKNHGMKEWVGDGLMLGIILAAAFWMACIVHHGMSTNFGLKLVTDLGGLNYFLIARTTILTFMLGFVVGAVVIGTARSVANSGLAVDSTT